RSARPRRGPFSSGPITPRQAGHDRFKAPRASGAGRGASLSRRPAFVVADLSRRVVQQGQHDRTGIQAVSGFRLIVFFSLLLTEVALAQRRRSYGGGEGWRPEYETCRTAREVPSHSTGTPSWTNTVGFENDVFTFARIRCDRTSLAYRDYWSGGEWWIDFPDSDLNLSFRLQQMTSIKVNPDGRVLNLTDKELFDYPWIYMVEPGHLLLKDEEVPVLRKYLLNGGVLMADDFWGDQQWEGFHSQLKRVLPEREFIELPMEHPIFHSVFSLDGPKSKLQTPNVRQGEYSQ